MIQGDNINQFLIKYYMRLFTKIHPILANKDNPILNLKIKFMENH